MTDLKKRMATGLTILAIAVGGPTITAGAAAADAGGNGPTMREAKQDLREARQSLREQREELRTAKQGLKQALREARQQRRAAIMQARTDYRAATASERATLRAVLTDPESTTEEKQAAWATFRTATEEDRATRKQGVHAAIATFRTTRAAAIAEFVAAVQGG